jgi:DNA-binding NarL/FixJ family response regulator
MSPSTVRVLVVDDYEPFRRFVCSTLRTIPALQIIGEVSDGLEAVRKAAELKPDLILLDIGLPTLNGIEVARQISTIAPESKVIFVTQESCPDVMQATLSLGAWGYVLKAKAASDLLLAVEAVLLGKRFVSRI